MNSRKRRILSQLSSGSESGGEPESPLPRRRRRLTSEIEYRCEARIRANEQLHQEAIARLVHDRDAQQSEVTDRLAAAESEVSRLQHEVGRLREVIETLSANVDIETRSARVAQEAECEAAAQLAAAQLELRSLKAAPPDPRLDELRQELMSLRAKYESLKETHEKLQAQILTRGVEEGRRLLDGVSESLVATNSLAHELSQIKTINTQIKHEVGLLRGFAETLSANADIETRSAREAQEAECEAAAPLSAARDAQRREREAAETVRAQLAAAQLELRSLKAAPPDPRLDELSQELTSLRAKYESLKETHEKLQAQILTRGVEEGRRLLDGVSGSLVATNSLEHKLSQMSKHELQKALKEEQDVTLRLKDYINRILLKILENYPQLLEVNYQKPNSKS